MRQTPDSERVDVIVCGSNDFGRYQKISDEQTLNMFLSDSWLVNTSGYQRILKLLPDGGALGRGIFTSIRGNILIAVIGSQVFSLDFSLNPTLIGSLATDRGEVFIDENLNAQIAIVDGLNIYIYNYSLPPNLTIQTGLGTLIPNYVSFHNTYFLFGNANVTSNGAAWYAYQYATPTTIIQATPGQFALQTKPDFALAVVRIPAQGSNVLVFGTSVCEIWTQIGGLQNYRKNSTISIDYGCLNVNTIVTSDTYICWLAVNENNSPTIMIYTGQGAAPVSTDGIDYQLSKIQFPSQSTAMFYRQDGHLFYQLTFTNAVDNVTLLYDLDTQKFYSLSDFNMNFHPAREYAYFRNNLYFISLLNGSLYESSTDFTTYNENIVPGTQDITLNLEIPRVRICKTLRREDGSQFRVSTFSFTLEQGQDPGVTGVSLANEQNYIITEIAFAPPNDIIYTESGLPIGVEGSGDSMLTAFIPYQPRVDVSVSRDSGYSWSNIVGRNLNAQGYGQNILNWDKMGSSNSLTIKIYFVGLYRFIAYSGFVDTY